MRDDHKRRPDRAIQFQHQLEDVRRRLAVEIAGGFVGKNAARLGHQCPRERNALSLAAGQLAGQMPRPVTEPDALQHRLRLPFRLGRRHATDGQRHRDVLERREFRQQMMKLIDEAERAVAHLAAFRFGQRRERRAFDEYFASRWRVESAQQMQQRALAGARSADDGDTLARANVEIDAHQHRNVKRSIAIRLAKTLAGEHRHLCASGLLIHSGAPRRD